MSHRALSPRQFDLAQLGGLHPSLGGEMVPDVIRGRTARHVMERAGIRQTKVTGISYGGHEERVDAPHIAGVVEGYGNYGYRPTHEELWTSQGHLHMPTLREYTEHGAPEKDPENDWEGDYEPETYVHGGKRWLAEGHHRTVASRLGLR